MQTGKVAVFLASVMWLGAGQVRQQAAPWQEQKMKQMRPMYEKVTDAVVRLRPYMKVYTDSPPCGDLRLDGVRIPDEVRKQADLEIQSKGARPPFGFPWRPPEPKRAAKEKRRDLSACARLVVVIPRSARITRIEKESKCPAGGWCGFAGEPVTEELDSAFLLVSVVFKNWSEKDDAEGRLLVFYRP